MSEKERFVLSKTQWVRHGGVPEGVAARLSQAGFAVDAMPKRFSAGALALSLAALTLAVSSLMWSQLVGILMLVMLVAACLTGMAAIVLVAFLFLAIGERGTMEHKNLEGLFLAPLKRAPRLSRAVAAAATVGCAGTLAYHCHVLMAAGYLLAWISCRFLLATWRSIAVEEIMESPLLTAMAEGENSHD